MAWKSGALGAEIACEIEKSVRNHRAAACLTAPVSADTVTNSEKGRLKFLHSRIHLRVSWPIESSESAIHWQRHLTTLSIQIHFDYFWWRYNIMIFRALQIVAASAALLALSGCMAQPQSPLYTRIEGTIKDELTSVPLGGVFVLVNWESMGRGPSLCTWIAATETDANGRFLIQVDPKKLRADDAIAGRIRIGGYPSIRFFKVGMAKADTGKWGDWLEYNDSRGKPRQSNVAIKQSNNPGEETISLSAAMRVSQADRHDRIRELLIDSAPKSECENFENEERIKKFYQAVAVEANAIAKTPYERKLSDVITARAESPIGRGARYPFFSDAISAAAGGATKEDLDARNNGDLTAVMSAVQLGQLAELKSLLQRGANPNRYTVHGDGINRGYNALTLAIEKYGYDFNRPADGEKFVAAMEILLAHKATNPNARPHYRTPSALMFAVRHEQDQMVELLLKAGADPNTTAYDDTALKMAEELRNRIHTATGQPSPSAARQYSLIISSPLLSMKEKERSAIRASSQGDVALLRLLLANGLDLNSAGFGTWSPLICATRHAVLNPQGKYADMVKLIASESGVNRTVVHEGQTALQIASAAKRDDLVSLLR